MTAREKKTEQLILHCKEISLRYKLQKEKTEGLQEMAKLARAGEKDSEEFKTLDRQYRDNTVIDFSDPILQIVKIVDKL